MAIDGTSIYLNHVDIIAKDMKYDIVLTRFLTYVLF